MAPSDRGKKLFAIFLASSLLLQTNLSGLACSAADSSVIETATVERPAADNLVANNLVSDETKSLPILASVIPPGQSRIVDLAAGDAGEAGVESDLSASAMDSDNEVAGDEKESILKSPLLLAAGEPIEGFKLTGGASISPDETPDKIDQITKEILLKEIELERYNLHYSLEVAKQGRWKGWRYAGFQEINAGMGLTGAIISTSYRGARLDNAVKVRPCIQESANYVPMIGSIIGASAAVIEFGINGYHDMVARKNGFAPSAAIAKVGGLKNDIDRLLAERDRLTKLEETSQKCALHAEIDEAEAKVLKDLRDQSLQEFERFHVGARRTLAFQQMQYFFDFAKNATNAIGYEFAYLSLHRHRRRYNGNAGAMFIVSGALTMFGPILSRMGGKGVAEISRHRIRPIVGDAESAKIATLEKDLANLNRLFKESQVAPEAIQKCVARGGLYGEHQKSFTDEIRAAEKKNNAAKLVATQNVGAGLYVGGTKVASGILFSIAGFNHHYNTKSVRSSHVTNDLLFTASVIAIPAGAFSMLDTLRIQVKGELNRHKQKAAGTLPGQIIATRLKQLDAMEANIKRN